MTAEVRGGEKVGRGEIKVVFILFMLVVCL